MADTDNTNRWREKYLNLIDDHEKLEKNAEHQQGQLRKALVMVSLLAEGQSTKVDEPLQQLRDAIKPKNKTVKLELLLNQLKSAVTKFETQKDAQAEHLLEQLHTASNQLLKLPLSKEEKSRIKSVRKVARKQLTQWSGYAQQLGEWAGILSRLTLEKPSDNQESEGFFSRLFGRSESSSEEQPQEETHQPKTSEENPAQTANETGAENMPLEATSDSEQLDLLVSEAARTLNSLLSQLVIPARLHPMCDLLRKQLGQPLEWNQLVPLLEQVSDLLIEALGTGQHEFEQFLQGLNDQLETIQQLLDQTSQDQNNKRAASQQFDQELKNRVDEIHSIVAGHEQLGELGNSIQQHLSGILDAMSNYRQQENNREQELTEQLQQLQQELASMEKTAQEAQAAIEEQRYKAMHDKLTGLPNREGYEQRLHQEQLRIQRYQNPLTLLVCDIDFFKRINDNYGHQAGDKVLQLVAKAFQKHIRDVDFVARFGGEEFIILMPETTSEQAFNAAEKLREVIAGAPFSFKKEPVQITMSIGISQFGKNEMESSVFERADKALYQAKENGRNQCVILDT